MIKERFKRLILPVLVGAVAALATLLIIGASRVTTTSSQGANVADAFHQLPEVPPDADKLTDWLPDQWNGTRRLDLPTRRNVEAAYIRAWTAMGRFAMYRDRDPVDAWFVGPAKAAVLAVPRSEASPVWSLGHKLELRFFSNDGTVIGLRDHRSRFVREIASPTGSMITATEERFDVVLTLENSYWRVRHLRRIDGVDTQTVIENGPGVSVHPLPERSGETPSVMRGINYEPRDTPFDAQWKNFDAEVTAKDFDTIVALGLDTIRIFVPYFEFGGEHPKPTEIAKLRNLLDLAADRKLRVIVTLFDGWVDHRPVRWPADESHLLGLIPAIKDHPALAMWDVKNEADLDDGLFATKLEVRAWVAHMIAKVRELDPVHPITVGWASAEAAEDPGMAALVDVVTFHWYLPANELGAAIERVKKGANGRPVMLGEFGLPTFNSVFPGGHTEAEQAKYYADILSTAKKHGVDSTLAWTLHDLKHAPPGVKLPWRVGPQKTLGVLRSDGSEKPAAAVLRPGFEYSKVPSVGFANRFQKKFWQLTILAVVAVILLLALGHRISVRRKGRRASP